MSTIKDSKLANKGHEEVSWASRQMQVLNLKMNFHLLTSKFKYWCIM